MVWDLICFPKVILIRICNLSHLIMYYLNVFSALKNCIRIRMHVKLSVLLIIMSQREEVLHYMILYRIIPGLEELTWGSQWLNFFFCILNIMCH
jgi:hypothetical protein